MNVALANDTDVADNLDSSRAQHVVSASSNQCLFKPFCQASKEAGLLIVSQSLGGSNHDGVTGVSAERIKILMAEVYVSAVQNEDNLAKVRTSMLQTVMQLSAASRTTSYSSSFQPFKLFSMRT